VSPARRGHPPTERSGVPPRAVFFDLDDTLFDHTRTAREALRIVRADQPILQRPPFGALCREYGRLLEAIHPEVLAGRISIPLARRRRFEMLAEFCGTAISAEEAESISQRYRAEYQIARRAVPGARAILERLRGRAIVGIVTNNEVREQEEKLAFLGLRGLVDVLVVSEEVGASKPDPKIFRTALDRAGVSAGEAVMLGDSWTADVQGAHGVGIRPIWLNRFGAVNLDPSHVGEITSLTQSRRVERALGGPFRIASVGLAPVA
jgi:HAD superfamily hydrolase (TIGR01549 family)